MSNVEHLKNPPLVGYNELVRIIQSHEESLGYLAGRVERQANFMAGVADYISSYQVIDGDKRFAVLDAFKRFHERESSILQERLKNLKAES